MSEKTITIPLSEYKELLCLKERMLVFAECVNADQYSVDREKCAIMLGFTIRKEESSADDV